MTLAIVNLASGMAPLSKGSDAETHPTAIFRKEAARRGEVLNDSMNIMYQTVMYVFTIVWQQFRATTGIGIGESAVMPFPFSFP